MTYRIILGHALMCGSYKSFSYCITSAITNVNCGAKKLRHFISAITLSNVLHWNDYWYIYIPINLEQNDIKIVSLSWSISSHTVLCQMQHLHTCSLPTSR